MNAITTQLIMAIGPTILKSVIRSMLNEEKLTEYRDEAITFLKGKAAATDNKIDDSLVQAAIDWVMEPGNYIKYTQEFCSLARRYITSTENEWDDIVFVPFLDRIEQLGVGK